MRKFEQFFVFHRAKWVKFHYIGGPFLCEMEIGRQQCAFFFFLKRILGLLTEGLIL